MKAVRNVNKIIAPKLIGKNVLDQNKIDELLIKLDGTKNKSNLGANAVLGVSIAACKAGAKAAKIPLWKWISEIQKQELLFQPLVFYLLKEVCMEPGG